MAPSMGHQAKLGMGTANPTTEPYEFYECGIGKDLNHLPSDGIRGTRSVISENVVAGTYSVGGLVRLRPSKANLHNLLPRILGGAGSGGPPTIYALAETIPDFYLQVDKIAKVFTYAGCKVNKATFRSSKNQPLMLDLDIHGKTETMGNAGTFPALTLGTGQPFTHHQVVVTHNAVTRECDNVVIEIDNSLVLDRFNNSQTRTELPESDRTVTLSLDVPFTSAETALYDLAVAGAAGSAVYTNGSDVLTFTFADLQCPQKPVGVNGKGEIIMRLSFVARMLSTTREVVVTLTP